MAPYRARESATLMLPNESNSLSTPLNAAPPTRSTFNLVLLLSAIYLIFVTQYAAIAVMAPFFPTSSTGSAIGQTMVGVVFAFYPLGTVFATPLPPLAMRAFGARAAVGLGLTINGLSSLAFGLTPRLLGEDSPAVLGATLCLVRAIGGVGAALAEAGTFTVITTADFGSRLGTIMSMVEVVIGLAAAGGTFAGGTLYSAGASTIFGAFLLPFVATSACTLSLVPLVWCALPSAKLEEDAGDGDEAATGGGDGGASLWGFSRLTTLTSTFAGSALIEAILPTIPPVLEDMGLDSAKVPPRCH